MSDDQAAYDQVVAGLKLQPPVGTLPAAPQVRVGEAPSVAEDAAARRRALMAVPQPDQPDNLGVSPLPSGPVAPLGAPGPQAARPGAYTLGGPDMAARAAFGAVDAGIPPDEAQQALALAIPGSDPTWTHENLPQLKANAERQAIEEQLAQAPRVAAYAAQSPVHAAAVKEDVSRLSFLEWALTGQWETATEPVPDQAVGPYAEYLRSQGGGTDARMAQPPAWLRGLKLGLLDIGAALTANKQAKVGLSPQEEAELVQMEQAAAAGVPGADTLPRKAVAEVSRALPSVGVFGSAALAGGGVGFLVAGPPGALVGAAIGTLGAAFTLGYGPLYRRLKTLEDGEGNPLLTEEEAKGWATGGAFVSAAAQTALGSGFLRALPGVAPALERLGVEVVAKAAADRAAIAAFRRLTEAGGHVLSGAMMMAAQGAINQAAIEDAKQSKGLERDWSAIATAGAEGFKSGLLLAPLAAFEPGRAFLDDLGRIHDAKVVEPAKLEAMTRAASGLNLIKSAPAEAEKLLEALAGQREPTTVFVSPEKLGPEMRGALELLVGPEAMAEAQVTRGDVAMPISRYLAHLADQHDALRQDVKLSADGLTPREAAATKPPDPVEALAALPAADRPQVEAALQPKPAPEPLPYLSRGHMLRDLADQVIEGKRLGDIPAGRYEEAARRAGDRLAAQGVDAAQQAVQGAGNISQGTGMQAASDVPGVGKAATRLGERQVRGAASALEGTEALEGARDFNRELARAAEKVRTEAEKNRKFLLGFTKDDARAELGKAGPEYLDQVDRILSGLELGQNVSRPEVGRRLATMQWVAQEQAAGRDPVIPQSVLDKLDRFVHWKELTPQELRDARASVESISRQAELKNTLLTAQGRRDREQAKQELIDGLNSNLERVKVYNDRNAAPSGAKRSAEVGRVKAALVRPEELIREMDGGQVDGPWSRYLWDPLRDGYLRWLEMRRDAAVPIKELVDGLTRDQKRKLKETRFTVDGEEYSLEAALSVALNSGADSNLSKMKRGWSDPRIARYGLTPWSDADAVHEQFLAQLDQRPWMWDFVEKGWQTLEGLKEPSFELERKLTGLRPPEVQPRSFKRTLADGTVREFEGGYYPMDYDPRVSKEAWARENNTDVPRTSGVFDPAYYRAATPQGHLIERSEGFARPTSLSVDALARHVNDATKDVAMREALLSAQDVLTDPDIRGALQQTVGEGGIKALSSFVRDTANELVVPDGGERAVLQALRRSRWGLQQARYAFNIAAAIRNLPNFANAAVEVPVGRLAEGLVDYVKSPKMTEEAVNEKSAEMRNRLLTFERDLSEKLREMEGKTGVLAEVQRWGMIPMEMTDKLVAYPAWLGSYREALASGKSEEVAIRQADRAVRLNVYAASVMDLPAIMRTPVGKMITLNYNFANMQLNQLFAAVSDARSANPQLRAAGARRVGMALFWTACVGTVAYELLSGRTPTNEQGEASFDPGDVAKWGIETTFSEPLMWLPLVRDVVGEIREGREANISPLDKPFSAVAKTSVSLWRVMKDAEENGQFDDELLKSFAGQAGSAAGYYLGLPVQQARATLGYLNAVSEGEEQFGPDAPLGLIWGKKRKGSLRELTGD